MAYLRTTCHAFPINRMVFRTCRIEQTMERNSGAYRHYQRTIANEARQRAGGQFAALDHYISKLDQPTAINSVQKSEADWIKFKEATGLEESLRRGRRDGFLEKKAFLNAAELKEHEREVEAKRRRVATVPPPGAP
eukprot:GHVQ01027132.1.p1 GENE.GHVQ01027132.1~~GHVQ01027132.1.p1  ORF type:complete len:136 (-),score=13.27 GHVQ01027132.1:274-681(-)